MFMHELPLEVIIEFVFPFFTDGELLHLRILSHDFEQVLLRMVTLLNLNENRMHNKVLSNSGRESLYRLLDKLENVQYLKGLRQVVDHQLLFEIVSRLPKLRSVENYYLNHLKLAKICPEYEIVDIVQLSRVSNEKISKLNVKRFKIGLVGECQDDDKGGIERVFKQLHYLEEIQCENYTPKIIWKLIKEERDFRVKHNQKLLLEKENVSGEELYPEIIRINFRYELYCIPDFSFCKEFPLILPTSNKEILEKLAPFCEEVIFDGCMRDLLTLLSIQELDIKELDLSKSDYNWIVPKNTSLASVVVRTENEQKIRDLEIKLFRKVIVQLLHRLKCLQVVKLSLPFNILVLFGHDLKANMSHYNLEKHAILDWIPLNFYASVDMNGTIPQLVLKKRKSCPQYEEPEQYEIIDFSELDELYQIKPLISLYERFAEPLSPCIQFELPKTTDNEFDLFGDWD